MGKNRGKGGSGKRKDQSVFKVAGSKVTKGKAKPVTTNLKRLNSKIQTEVADKNFSEVQAALVYKKKTSQDTKTQSKQSANQKCRLKAVPMDAVPDVNSAAEEFSKL